MFPTAKLLVHSRLCAGSTKAYRMKHPHGFFRKYQDTGADNILLAELSRKMNLIFSFQIYVFHMFCMPIGKKNYIGTSAH